MSKNTGLQPSLFEPENLHNVQVVKRIDDYDVLTTYGPEGSYTNVAERAGYLLISLVSMSERNRRDGFSIAPYREEYSEPIWARYRWNTETVIKGAGANRKAFQLQLRASFWRATGFEAIRGAGYMHEQLINPSAQKMWRDFNNEYGHPQDLAKRAKYKKTLIQQIGDQAKSQQIIYDARHAEAIN